MIVTQALICLHSPLGGAVLWTFPYVAILYQAKHILHTCTYAYSYNTTTKATLVHTMALNHLAPYVPFMRYMCTTKLDITRTRKTRMQHTMLLITMFYTYLVEYDYQGCF